MVARVVARRRKASLFFPPNVVASGSSSTARPSSAFPPARRAAFHNEHNSSFSVTPKRMRPPFAANPSSFCVLDALGKFRNDALRRPRLLGVTDRTPESGVTSGRVVTC